jgi:hypothetical protein
MFREKTRLELLETINGGEAERLREALFIIHGLDDIAEIKRVAQAAMAGEKHGLEIERVAPGYCPHS